MLWPAYLTPNQRMSFEGQAAMRLEFAALEAAPNTDESYPFEVTTITTVNGESVRIIDYAQVFEAIMREWRQGVSVADIARRFHQTLCAVILAQARAAALERVALRGGCFQNRLLLAGAVAALRRADSRAVLVAGASAAQRWRHRLWASDRSAPRV